MTYYILEIQKNEDGVYSHLVQTANTKNEADSKYYTVLSYAAISSLPHHAAVLLDENGLVYANASYKHETIN